jgi:hypothetical protein
LLRLSWSRRSAGTGSGPGIAFEVGRQRAFEGGAVDAVAQFQVDARQLAELVEAPLQRADVHHADALAGRARCTGPATRSARSRCRRAA